jgi:predicted porin
MLEMKKSLVFAMAMALGVSATAFAANPFSDVPAGHWAYAAVAKLAAAGIVDGYPDGTFKGDRTMTRYEMAQIVAKALAKGAIGADDKLVGEFADELDNLGVRVAKLEKNADNVKITGKVKLSYKDSSGGAMDGESDQSEARLRTDIFFTGEVNDNWHYVTMLRNQQYFEGDNESGDDDTDFQRAYLTGNIGVVNITGGRYNEFISDGNIYDNRFDGIKATVPFGDAYFKAEYGKMASKSDYDRKWGDDETTESAADKFWMTELGGTWGNFDLFANYMQADNQISMGLNGDDNKIWTVGATYHPGKFYLGAMYLKGDDDTLKGAVDMDGNDASDYDDDGFVVKMGWAGANSKDPGSWGLHARYYDQSAPTVIAHTMDGEYQQFKGEGYKGYLVGGDLTIAKNMVATVDYYDLKGKETDKHARTIWSQLMVTF